MIENLNMATKSEIQAEMERLSNDFEARKKILAEKMEEWRQFVQSENEDLKKMSEEYILLQKEMNKREGKQQ